MPCPGNATGTIFLGILVSLQIIQTCILNFFVVVVVVVVGFSTGLVRLYIAGLPLRSCRTIGAPSVQGSTQCALFSFMVAAGLEPMS